MIFNLWASSGLTQCRRFKGVTLGEADEPDPHADDELGEPGDALDKQSERVNEAWSLGNLVEFKLHQRVKLVYKDRKKPSK